MDKDKSIVGMIMHVYQRQITVTYLLAFQHSSLSIVFLFLGDPGSFALCGDKRHIVQIYKEESG